MFARHLNCSGIAGCLKLLVIGFIALALVACGGGGGGGHGSSSGTSSSASGTVDSDGAKIRTNDVTIVIPPAALETDTTIRIAQNSSGSPALPDWVAPQGSMYEFTPHGTLFQEPVTVRIKAPAITLDENQRLVLARAQPGGTWEILDDTALNEDGELEVSVQSFSFFQPVVITYVPPTGSSGYTLEPFGLTSMTLECNHAPCKDVEYISSKTVTAIMSTNNGVLPSGCVNPEIRLHSSSKGSGISAGTEIGTSIPVAYNQVVSSDVDMPLATTALAEYFRSYRWALTASLRCVSERNNSVSYVALKTSSLQLQTGRSTPGIPILIDFPEAISESVGSSVSISAIFVRGDSYRISEYGSYRAPDYNPNDHTTVYLESLAEGDNVWRIEETSQQADAFARINNSPVWLYWGFNYSIGSVYSPGRELNIITPEDNNRLYRMRGCYTDTANLTSCSSGQSARLTVLGLTTAPIFSTQPSSMSVNVGETASFSAVVSGVPTPTLQWQTRPANSTGSWNNVSGGNGATSSNYTSPALSSADSGTQFRLLATNSAGDTASTTVTVTVTDIAVAPSIVSQPQNLTVVAGSQALFSVHASGTAALSYQWRKDGTNIDGANGSTLLLNAVASDDQGQYSVVVSNSVGNATSTAAQLTVTDAVATPTAPTIVTQPAAIAIHEGNSATFAVGVVGTGPFSYQWRKNNINISGATAAAYTIPAAVIANGGNYSVVVTNSVGSTTSNQATLGVVALPSTSGGGDTPVAPTIVDQTHDIIVTPGMAFTLAVSVQGSDPLTYQWYREGVPLFGESSAILTIDTANVDSAGSYQVEVTNSVGGVTSDAMTVTLLDAPVITTHPADTTVTAGQTATFTVIASGDNLNYQWLRNGEEISGAVYDTYTTDTLATSNNGEVYTVLVSNGAGARLSLPGVLFVYPAPTAALQAKAIAAGNLTSMAVALNGTVWAWGQYVDPVTGGYNVATYSNQPVQVPGLTNVKSITVTSGSSYYALHEDGTVSAWGMNMLGELGDQTTTFRSTPVSVLDAAGIPMRGVCSIAAGANTLIMARKAQCDLSDYPDDLTASDTGAWVVGRFTGTSIGGTNSPSYGSANGAIARQITGLPSGVAVRSITMPDAAGSAPTSAIIFMEDDTAWAWGANGDNHLGLDNSAVTFAGDSNTLIDVTSNWIWSALCVEAEMGANFSLCRSQDGLIHSDLLGIGRNQEGQLGTGNTDLGTVFYSFVRNITDGSLVLTDFSAGYDSAAAISSGQVWAWGWDGTSAITMPVRLDIGGGFTQVSVGDSHGLAIGPDAEVYGWGNSNLGSLGADMDSVTLHELVKIMLP